MGVKTNRPSGAYLGTAESPRWRYEVGTSRRAHHPIGSHSPLTSAAGASDDELMLRFCNGDAWALGILYDRYANGLFGLGVNLLGDRTEAEDALQETFVRVIDGRHRFEPRDRFKSWIFTVCRRICLDRLRALGRQEVSLRVHRLELARAKPSDTMLVQADLERLLSTLPPEQREVLVLHWMHGFSHAEIAEMTGATEAGVKQKAYRALKVLRSHAEDRAPRS